MRCAWLAVILAAACFKHIDYANCTDCQRDSGSDALGDGMLDADDYCFGHSGAQGGYLKVCPAIPPAPMMFTVPTDIKTDTDPRCAKTAQVGATGPMVCVLVGTDVYIDATMTATGTLPLAIVATGTIHVLAPINVGSLLSIGAPGAGGGRDCGAQPGVTGAGDGGGGAGGSFGTGGGSGGAALGAAAGSAGIASAPTDFEGGCNGGNGGQAGGMTGASAGLGGGAVYLIARTEIRISGSIVAGGAGGTGGTLSAGGGGGGTGGMIGLDAPTITYLSGVISTSGGGGGQAGGAIAGTNGADGGGATGGTGGADASDCGGTGGVGGGLGAPSKGMATSTNGCGGGGGGGSVGIIHVLGTVTGSPVYVPTPS